MKGPALKPSSREPDREPRAQFAALPWRLGAEGAVEVLLITSRETRRWVIPKGWPIKGRSSAKSAAREAFEEAGVVGKIGKAPIGVFAYDKALTNGWPIATGVIEGACRHLIKDRLDITGARWSVDGAEAVLRLRALRSSGDFEAY